MLVFQKQKNEFGLGNLFIVLTSLEPGCTHLHDSVYEYELSNCVILNGFTRVSHEGVKPDYGIALDSYTYTRVHTKIRDIVSPTPHMQDLIEKHRHLIQDVSAAMSIRRGSYCEDSKQYKDERGDKPYQFFCSTSGLEKFKKIIRDTPGRIFVSSDSVSTLQALIEEFGTKISYLEMPYTVTSTQDQDEYPSIENLQKVYLKWFLLSECPIICVTAGKNFVGFSTYAYIAAVYGNKKIITVEN